MVAIIFEDFFFVKPDHPILRKKTKNHPSPSLERFHGAGSATPPKFNSLGRPIFRGELQNFRGVCGSVVCYTWKGSMASSGLSWPYPGHLSHLLGVAMIDARKTQGSLLEQ